MVDEQIYRFRDKVGSRVRPFSESAGVNHRCYSRALQRVVCDFGADHAFGKVNAKLKEHYGITLPESSPRVITEYHAQQISEQTELKKPVLTETDIVIAECDGSMIPIVETRQSTEEDKSKDRRKNKELFWKEARLSLAHAKGSKSLYFAGTMESVQVAGQQLLDCVNQSGANQETWVHCVGDGAPWIANQVEEQFGMKGSYLIDFYHLCEYLSASAPVCAGNESARWLKRQKERMKLSQYEEVLNALQPYIEPRTIDDAHAPVRACYRYIKNRPEQLDYKKAQDKGLPIGSGEIESAHRYVLQKRLKLAGAWWKIDNAKHMINLRVCRANELWEAYWKKAA
jgi:hypothetical protein